MNSFPKSKRLIQSSDYQYVFTKAKKINCYPFLILHRPSNGGIARIGLAIAKKKIAKAHDRNRLKRVVRESFRQMTLPKADIVVIAHAGGEQVENPELYRQLGKIWQNLQQYYAK